MNDVRIELEKCLRKTIDLAGIESPPEIGDETVLMGTGLDSLALAMLVVQLEEILGYDPFVLMEDPVYPRTFGEFVQFYQRFANRCP